MSSGFLPSPVKYFQSNGDQTAEESVVAPVTSSQDNSLTSSSDPQPRLGYPIYAGSNMVSKLKLLYFIQLRLTHSFLSLIGLITFNVCALQCLLFINSNFIFSFSWYRACSCWSIFFFTGIICELTFVQDVFSFSFLAHFSTTSFYYKIFILFF